MHHSVMDFGRAMLNETAGKQVLEVGSYNVNGTIRDIVEPFGPKSYIGVDINEGPGVDSVCSAIELKDRFGSEAFDLVVSTEMLEHAQDWQAAINNMKSVLRIGGSLLLTTRSVGFPYHNPPDYWRFELDHMRKIFSDFEMAVLQSDPQVPGVLFYGRKLTNETADLSGVEASPMFPI